MFAHSQAKKLLYSKKVVSTPQCLQGHGLTIHSQILRPKNPPLFVGGNLFSYPSPQIPEDSESGIFSLIPWNL